MVATEWCGAFCAVNLFLACEKSVIYFQSSCVFLIDRETSVLVTVSVRHIPDGFSPTSPCSAITSFPCERRQEGRHLWSVEPVKVKDATCMVPIWLGENTNCSFRKHFEIITLHPANKQAPYIIQRSRLRKKIPNSTYAKWTSYLLENCTQSTC